MTRKKGMCSLLLLVIFAAVGLSACGADPAVNFESPTVPRSTYDPKKEVIFNEYFGFDLDIQSGWEANNDAEGFAIQANLSEEQQALIREQKYEDVALIPDFTVYMDNGDTITVFYRNLAADEYAGKVTEDFRADYMDYYSERNHDIRSQQLSRKNKIPNANIKVADVYFLSEKADKVSFDGIDFLTAKVDAPYRGKDAYEYAAFAEKDGYVICIVAATEQGTSIEDFWEVFAE